MKNLTLNIARVLLIIGLGIGLKSWWMTTQHVGDQNYTLISNFTKGEYHAWYHAFREAIGDLAAMVILIFIFFGNKTWRTPKTWYVSLILIIGYYAPFWVGTPFYPELAAPHITAEIVHLSMAIPTIIALFLARKSFFNTSLTN
ncbi:hypothetical protein [Tenacibaculum salmonis]|uniref:hypothetical protein n=1 Tax=Tenacibaculum sp. P3-BQ1 TaxID=3232310 RepID=UPI0034DDFB6D